MGTAINTERLSLEYRSRSIDVEKGCLLVTRLQGSAQETDLSEPVNSAGFGRVRHFRRRAHVDWVPNPLPMDPACKALKLPKTETLRAQVYQNAACNWRCWYCFVPFDLLAANRKYSDWLTPKELVDLYLNQSDPPKVIDLSGGQPDLVPEWIPWMMNELKIRGLDQETYLWSDDNLSNDYFWRFLSDSDIEMIASYPNYGKVCCLKGFDSDSFAFNTSADPSHFDKQFSLLGNLVATGIDIYLYATFTTPTDRNIKSSIPRLIDRLQNLHINLPLRTVPLKIELFTPVLNRLNQSKRDAVKFQHYALEAWCTEIENRFSITERNSEITEIRVR